VSEEKLQALSDYENSRVFEAGELAVLRYADSLTTTPVDVSDDVFAAVQAIYDDVQIVELTSAVAWENYRARFDHALKIEAEGFSEGSFCPLPIIESARNE
jgi:alkylhydroperoxidase family enzyme